MKVVWHHYKIVQSKFVLGAIVIENMKEQCGGLVSLQEVSLAPCGGSDEKRASASLHLGWVAVADRDGHKNGG